MAIEDKGAGAELKALAAAHGIGPGTVDELVREISRQVAAELRGETADVAD